MKILEKIFAGALVASTFVVMPASAGTDSADLTVAKNLCRAEVSKQTGAPDDQLRNGSFKLKAKTMTLKVIVKTEAGPKSATCAFDRKTQTVSLTFPEGVPVVAATTTQ